MKKQKALLRELFDVAVAAASPANCLRTWLPERPAGRIRVIGAGKAAASMAHELEQAWQGPLAGLVIVPYGYVAECQSIEVVEAAHPIPDAAGVAAAARILDSVSGLSASDTVVCLISGGGSSLLCLPIDGVTLAEKRDITSQLLLSGAAINEINCVRKKLSAIKGGKLAAACAPARVLTLIISDVPGNDIAMVASGPTVSDASPASEALDILDRYAITMSDTVRQSIQNSRPVTIAAGDVRILASSDDAIIASAALADKREITPYVLGDLSGDARTLAREHAELAMQIAAGHGPLSPPCVVLSGGETTVNVRGNGRGGRNGEYALALAIALNGHPAIHAIACDTDGIDGNGDNAGSFVSPDILERAANAGIDAKQMLERNDSYGFFSATLDLIITGPTGTNVNDFRALLISDS